MARNRAISTRGRWQQPPHRVGLAGPAQKPRAVDPAWDSVSLCTPALLTAHIRELKTTSLQLHTACSLHVSAFMPHSPKACRLVPARLVWDDVQAVLVLGSRTLNDPQGPGQEELGLDGLLPSGWERKALCLSFKALQRVSLCPPFRTAL